MAVHTVPSIATLRTLPGLEPGDVPLLRKVLDGRVPPQAVDTRIEREHVGAPRLFSYEAKLRAADIILRTHGVEWLAYECQRGEDHDPEGFYYLNAGDTYNATLAYFPRTRTFRVTTWGDEVERHERRCAECRRMARGE